MSQYKFKINGNEYNVEINSISGDSAVVTVNGIQYSVESGVAACTAAAGTIAQAPAVQSPASAPVQAAAPAAAP
ncbi:MAG: acetyl-CoA carboxylase biotin carboxyl carrier protein subunit, partial [Bacteroidetes bacterium]|nr:acetyl-CoA carboxylase biotin carboxyl carrier protein subunit [Candidatus Cryptobacteroides merdigallinarum]